MIRLAVDRADETGRFRSGFSFARKCTRTLSTTRKNNTRMRKSPRA